MRYECIASKLRVGRLGKTILGILVRVGTDLAFGHAEIQRGWLPWSNISAISVVWSLGKIM